MARKPINLDNILKNNPQINPKDLERDKALAEELSKIGIKPRGYRLSPAFDRRRATICDENDDSRIVNSSISLR